jgi:hypothetical protein
VAELRRTAGQIAKSISNLYAQEFKPGMSTQAADRGEPKCGMRSCWWQWLSPSSRSRSHIQASTGREAELVEDRSDAALSGSPVAIRKRPSDDLLEIEGAAPCFRYFDEAEAVVIGDALGLLLRQHEESSLMRSRSNLECFELPG